MISDFNLMNENVHLEDFDVPFSLDEANSDLNGTNQYLSIHMEGYFIREGVHFLVFTCMTRDNTRFDNGRTLLEDPEGNEIGIGLAESAGATQALRFLAQTDADFTNDNWWGMTINVRRGGRRGVWKYTKGSAL